MQGSPRAALACAAAVVPLSAQANSAAVSYFGNRADRSAVPTLLSREDRDWYKGLFAAIDAGDWTKLQTLLTERPDGLRDALLQFLQAGTQHLVVIAPPGIDRDNRLARPLQTCLLQRYPVGWRALGQVIDTGGDDAHRTRHQLGRACPFHAVAGHVVHAAVKTGRQPSLQSRFGIL